MNDFVVWIIIAAFYAPLHFLAPALFLFITGTEDEATRKRLIKHAVLDSALSMALAFGVVIVLVQMDLVFVAMLILLLSMAAPFVRIWRHRREIAGRA